MEFKAPEDMSLKTPAEMQKWADMSKERAKKINNACSKIRNGQVLTKVIGKDEFPSYLEVASATGFEVEQLAGEGEEYPSHIDDAHERVYNRRMERREREDGKYTKEYEIRSYLRPEPRSLPEIVFRKVEYKGFIAVSIEKPKGSKDHTPFWDNLRSLQQKKV